MSLEDRFALQQMQSTIEGLDRRSFDDLKALALQLAHAWISQRAASRTLVLQAAEGMTAPFRASLEVTGGEEGPTDPPG